MVMKNIARIVLYGVGLTSIAALVYLAGPLVAIGDWRPLENHIIRDILCVLILAAGASLTGFSIWKHRKNTQQIAEGLVEGEAKKNDNDSVVLKEKMKDALTTLKSASSGKRDFLYDLPWYVIIGPPGAGKTTALINSGLKFPLSRGQTPAAIAGVGGTRYCDWWFTEDAVLIDTAGRYTTQDSDSTSDKQSWFSFLGLLKKNRPRQPINGVMVVISLEDLMTLPPNEIQAHANAIGARLLELHEHLKVDFPVYAIFSKADLVSGFTEFFASLNEQGRHQVWGATFQTADKTRNLVAEVPQEYDALVERLNDELTDRLQDEPSPNSRVLLFGFPSQMAALKQPIYDFLNQIFEPTRYHANATLRGFYFASGTQEGTPIDRIIGALARSFGAEEVAGTSMSGSGKSFFLTDLIRKVIIGEAAWVSTDLRALMRSRIIKAAAYAVVASVTIGLCATWWTSYIRNKALIAQTNIAIAEYKEAAGPTIKETVIADREFAKVLPFLHRLRFLPAGYANRNIETSIWASFGLSQRERLQSASEGAYRAGLERMFRSRLIYRLEELLESNRNNVSFSYEALKVYMMLGGLQAPDKGLILSWWRRDWANNLYPGPANNDGRKALEDHLVALLDLDTGDEPLIKLNGALIEETQRTLARLDVGRRAYEMLKSQALGVPGLDWVISRKGGQDFNLVFEATGSENLDDIKVSGFFTYNGFQRLFVDRLGDIGDQIKRERWVLGAAGEQSAVAVQYDTLNATLLDLYTRDFVAAWRDVLTKIQLKRLTGDKPRYLALSAASSTTSPIRQLLESIRDETALTRPRPDAQEPQSPAPGTSPGVTPTLLQQGTQQQATPLGANIEAAFKGFAILFEGDSGRRPIDALIGNLGEIYQSMTLAATNPALQAQAESQLQVQVAALRGNANRLPQPFQDMFIKAAGVFESDLTNSSHGQLVRALGDQVTGVCNQIVPNRYPFSRGVEREVPLSDFGRLFAPNGIIDSFFKKNLEPMVNMSQREWAWRAEHPLGRTLSSTTLREFQRAAQIRDTFFSTGGNMPSIMLGVTPPALSAADATVKMDINGVIIESKQGSSSPVAVQWPGAGGGRTAISVEQTAFGNGGTPSVLQRTGVWSLFRLLDAAAPVQRGDRVIASFIVGGRDLQYQFGTGTAQNPLVLPALREFHCPNGI